MPRSGGEGPAATAFRRWDPHSKRVLTAGLAGVLDCLGLDLGTAWRPATVELPAGSRHADLLFVSATGVGLHLEVQQAPAADMAWRMADYAVRLPRSTGLSGRLTDLVQVVVQVTGGPMAVTYVFGGMTNRVHLLHVPSVDSAHFLATAPLAPFALVSGREAAVPGVIAALDRVTDQDTRAAMAALALHLAPELAATIIQGVRRAGMTDLVAELRRTDFGRELLAEGREQGREQGRAQGREEERRRMLGAVLAARFPAATPARIEATVARLLAEESDPAGAALAIGSLDPAR